MKPELYEQIKNYNEEQIITGLGLLLTQRNKLKSLITHKHGDINKLNELLKINNESYSLYKKVLLETV